MESYKILNRELSLKNQELRTSLAGLRNDVVMLEARLIREREQQQELKKSVVCLISESFNAIIKLLYPDSENQLMENRSNSNECRNFERNTASVSLNKSSSLLVQIDGRGQLPAGNEDTNKENICTRNITIRSRNRRVNIENRENRNTPSETVLQETIESFEEYEQDEEDSMPSRRIFRITEEDSEAIDNARGDLTVSKSRPLYDSTLHNVINFSGEPSSFLFDESSLNPEFSSTPFKTAKKKHNRSIKVAVPKLKPEVLQRYGIKLASNKSIRKASRTRKSTDSIDKSMSKDPEISPQVEKLREERPKRKAAPKVLVEPSLHSKLRRKV